MGANAVPENSALFTDYFFLLTWIKKTEDKQNPGSK
jgi:hypothetical protein